MTETVQVAEQFRGPPNSGNGGYVSGVAAKFVDGIAEVTIRAPVPLDTDLEVKDVGQGEIRIFVDGKPVMIAKPGRLDMEVPEPPSFEEAAEASKSSLAIKMKSFFGGPERLGIHPTCFCCGNELAEDVGLRLAPGKIDGRELVAAPWVPHKSLCDESGVVPSEIVWAALDCPGAFAFLETGQDRVGMLGRLVGEVTGQAVAGERCIVIGWPILKDGRRMLAGTAVFNSAGERIALALATWFGRA